MAYRLQTSAPELMDLRGETKATLEMYGADPARPSFARACLLARRMIERRVRFFYTYHAGWDAASNLISNHRKNSGGTHRACEAMLTDTKKNGQLHDSFGVSGDQRWRT